MSKSCFTGMCKGLAALASLLLAVSLSATPPPGLLDLNNAAVRTVISAQQEVTGNWMLTPGILGTAVGLDAAGAPALVVYVDRDDANAGEVARSLPAETGGAKVRVEMTDNFRALAGGP
jgi:hypothetical protein